MEDSDTSEEEDTNSLDSNTCSESTNSDHTWECLPQSGTKHRREGILRMEDTKTSEEKDTEREDSNICSKNTYSDTPQDASHSQERKVKGKESWQWKAPRLR